MAFVTDVAPTATELDTCIRCGLCLPACPTFRLTGKESASPRGRLAAMSMVLAGDLEVEEAFDEVISFCLGCRACEAVCPGLVPYGRVFEGSRAELAAQRPTAARRSRRLILGSFLNRRALIRLVTALIAVGQRLGVARRLRGPLGRAARGLRPLPIAPRRWSGTAVQPDGSPKARVGLLAGCVMEAWFGEVHAAAVGLLSKAGYEVVVPASQGCCGALAAHDGHIDAARRMAEANRIAFAGCDIVVADAAGCSAHLRHYAELTGAGLDAEVLDVTELIARCLADGSLVPSSLRRGDAAIQDPCHLRHAQRVTAAPREIVAAAGYRPVEIDPDGLCCGAAGIYSLLEPETSGELGARKAAQVRGSGAGVVASANPGCEMQLRAHLPGSIRVAHPIELLWEAVSPPASR